jgi:hypothetical protein
MSLPIDSFIADPIGLQRAVEVLGGVPCRFEEYHLSVQETRRLQVKVILGHWSDKPGGL